MKTNEMVKRILTATIVLSLVFFLKLADSDKVGGYSYDANYIDNTRLTSAFVNPTYPSAADKKTTADPDNTVTESDETNNAKTYTFSALTPDLIIQEITWSPTHPSIGDTVTFTVTIKNQGSSQADYSRVTYYINNTYLTSDSVNPIDAGATVAETFTWTAQAGSHAIKAVADANNEVTESNETNNVKTYTLSTLAPDLIIQDITWSPEDPSKGDSIAFSVTIKNQGSARAGSSRVTFYIDGSSRGYQEVQRIDAGATATNTFTWTAQAGSHAIKAVTDLNDTVPESDEDNNEKTVTFSTLAPDLIIESISWSPAGPSIGDTVTFTVTIKNQGSGNSDYSRVAYYINNTYLTSDLVNPIDAGGTDDKTFTWTARIGSHAIKAVADSNDTFPESDEDNNEKTVTFSTLAPDLVIQDITWSPENSQKGDSITFSVTIKNQGSARAGSSRVTFYIDGSSRGYQEVQRINAGATATKTFNWIARVDSHAIKAVADPNDTVTESDEDNNEKTVTFSALPPDLIIEAISWSPAGPSIGDTVTFTVTIKNRGSGKSDYSRVAYYIDDTYLTSASANPIDAGGTDNKTFTWTAQAGSHAIKAVADPNDTVTESNETNNVKTYAFSALTPDLIIESITGSPAGPSIGDTITFSVTIKNQGSASADFSRVYFYIDGSSRGYQEVQEIDADATVTKTFTWTAQAGSHAIKAVADPNDTVTESDEDNNEKTVTFPAPDLIIEAISWSPENPQKGDNVTFSVTLKNQGSDRADSSRVYFYTDGSSRGYQDVQGIDVDATVTKTFTWTAQVGSHAIKAVADPDDTVTESDEDNNEKTVTFSVFLPPAPIPAPATTPSTKPQEAPAGETIPVRSPWKGLWPDLSLIFAAVIWVGASIMLLRYWQRQH